VYNLINNGASGSEGENTILKTTTELKASFVTAKLWIFESLFE